MRKMRAAFPRGLIVCLFFTRPFFSAAQMSNFPALAALLLDPNRNPLTEKQMEAALHKQKSVNDRDGRGYTALHIACANGNVFAVRWLLKHDADKHALLRDGFTTPVIETIRGCAITAGCSRDRTAEQITERFLETLRALYNGGVDVHRVHRFKKTRVSNAWKSYAMLAAVSSDCADCLEWLLTYGGMAALETGDMDHLLYTAVSQRYARCIKVLMRHGARVNDTVPVSAVSEHIAARSVGWTPLMHLCDFDYEDALENFSPFSSGPDYRGADDAAKGVIACIRTLVGEGEGEGEGEEITADVNKGTPDGTVTPLSLAVAGNSVAVVKELLRLGAIPDARTLMAPVEKEGDEEEEEEEDEDADSARRRKRIATLLRNHATKPQNAAAGTTTSRKKKDHHHKRSRRISRHVRGDDDETDDECAERPRKKQRVVTEPCD